MAKLKVGDRVIVPGGSTGTLVKVVGYRAGWVCKIEIPGSAPVFLREDVLKPATDTKSLRAKYKAAPSKRDMVLIGEWNAPESGPGTFYAPRSRRSQVERTFLAIEEGDESKEAFYSVINAGGVFIRD